MKRLVLILLPLLCVIQLSAQTVLITGTVYDETGELICQELGTRVRWDLAGHPVESIRFEGFELISVEKKTLPDQGDMDTSAYCFKREEAKTKEN